jgi:hypothetical protein
MSRHRSHRREHARVADTATRDLRLDHTRAIVHERIGLYHRSPALILHIYAVRAL